MTIAGLHGKCKSLAANVPRDMLGIAILVLTSSASFALGYLAGQDAPVPILTESLSRSIGDTEAPTATSSAGSFVASKNGMKYYLPGCAGAGRISDANKVWFATAAAAVVAGYVPAANCKGL